jgi:hypothetical protein
MRKFFWTSCFIGALTLVITGCKKEAAAPQEKAITPEVLEKIAALGFSNKDVAVHEDGYLVEGDIIVTAGDMDRAAQKQILRVGSEEQYRTTNLVKALPRNIKVSISSRLPASYVTALDIALKRFNDERLLITFTRVSSGADISVVKGAGNYLASAGFPTSGGSPYSQVKINSNAMSGQPQNTIASVIAHEIGHCIGFRHTDYMSRQYSCGGSPANEGASTVGAIHIPGTPTGPDANSWMLSCIGSGQNRPFNANDRTALSYLY